MVEAIIEAPHIPVGPSDEDPLDETDTHILDTFIFLPKQEGSPRIAIFPNLFSARGVAHGYTSEPMGDGAFGAKKDDPPQFWNVKKIFHEEMIAKNERFLHALGMEPLKRTFLLLNAKAPNDIVRITGDHVMHSNPQAHSEIE